MVTNPKNLIELIHDMAEGARTLADSLKDTLA